MDKYKKISFILNDKNEIEKVVLFMDNASPIVDNYDAEKHSKFLERFIVENKIDDNSNLIDIIGPNDKEKIEKLYDEISSEKAKNQNKRYKSILNLSRDDSELEDYFALEVKRNKKIITDEELIRIASYVGHNERISVLEEARERVKNGNLSRENFEKLHNVYRLQLRSAIKKARPISDREYDELKEYFEYESEPKNVANQVKIKKLAENNSLIGEIENAKALYVNANSVNFISADFQKYKNDYLENYENTRAFYENLLKRAEKTNSYVEEKQKSNDVVLLNDLKDENVEKENIVDSLENTSNNLNESKVNKDRKLVLEKNKVPGTTVEGKIDDTADYTSLINVDGKEVKVRSKKKLPIIVAGVLFALATVGVLNLLPEKIKNKVTNYIENNNKDIIHTSVIDSANNGQETLTQELSYFDPNFESYNVLFNKDNGKSTEESEVVGKPSQVDSNVQRVGIKLNSTNINLYQIIQNYFVKMNVKEETRAFIMSDAVQRFLSQYKNEEQIYEVLSALCYGYEANILFRKDGNFRIEEDGDIYLYAFTNDFLCAKVFVNNYTAAQMRAIFGNSQISYEQLTDGFRNFYNTVATYGTTALEPLPFKYLTNGVNDSTKMLNNLFEKLIIVNRARDEGTLTREQTDAFIVELDKIYIQNDGSVSLTAGAKTVGRALADSFMFMQANMFNGNALVLSKDYGLSLKGLSLTCNDEDDDLILMSKNGTKYPITNILQDVMHTNLSKIYDPECISQQTVILNNLNEMNSLNVMSFVNFLYRNGMYDYAHLIESGKYDGNIFEKIESESPALALELEKYSSIFDEYVPYEVTVNGIDELLNIKGYKNDYATLINIRRDLLPKMILIRSGGGYGSYTITTTKVETNVEKVDYNDLTQEEKKIVDEQVQEMEKKQNEANDKQKENAEKVAQEIVVGVQENGMTKEEAEQKASEVGMTLEPNIVEELKEMYEGKEVTEAFDREIERKNTEEINNAEDRNERETAEQNARRAEEEALINASLNNSSSGTNNEIGESQNNNQNNGNSIDETQVNNGIDLKNNVVHEIQFDENGDISFVSMDRDSNVEIIDNQLDANFGSDEEVIITSDDEQQEENPVQEQVQQTTQVEEQKQESGETVSQVQTDVDLNSDTVYEIDFENNGELTLFTANNEQKEENYVQENTSTEEAHVEEQVNDTAPKEETHVEEQAKETAPKEETHVEEQAKETTPKEETHVEETVFEIDFDSMIDPDYTDGEEEVYYEEVSALREIRDTLINLDSLGIDAIDVNNGRSKVLKRNA